MNLCISQLGKYWYIYGILSSRAQTMAFPYIYIFQNIFIKVTSIHKAFGHLYFVEVTFG